MNSPELNPDDDERLGTLFRQASFPAVPRDLDGRVRRRSRIRSRRRRVLVSGACAAAALLGLVLWHWPGTVGTRDDSRPIARAPEGLPDARELFADPPVANLDVLTRQQDAYLALLDQLQEE